MVLVLYQNLSESQCRIGVLLVVDHDGGLLLWQSGEERKFAPKKNGKGKEMNE